MRINMEYYLRLVLVKNSLSTTLEVSKELSDNDADLLIRIITKARKSDINLSPLVKFLGSDDLSYLTNNGWQLTDADFIITKEDLLEYYKGQGVEGGSIGDAQKKFWLHVPNYVIGLVNFQLMKDGILDSTPYFESGGYVLSELKDEHMAMAAERRKNKPIEAPEPKKKETKPQIKTKITLTNKDKSNCRKSIISKAKASDMCAAGFRPEFVESLSEKEQSYIATLTNLQVKLMMNEVTKK